MDVLESELIVLVEPLDEELQAPHSTVPETWKTADMSPRLHGRPFRYSEFHSIVTPPSHRPCRPSCEQIPSAHCHDPKKTEFF